MIKMDAREQLISAFPTSSMLNKRSENSSESIKKIIPPKPILQQDQSKKRPNKWVSNLLERASREETFYDETPNDAILTSVQTKPRPANSSLNSLASGIVQAINHNAIVELWDHYQRGQKNIVTERLYTLNGKTIFEMIKKKYMSDFEFKRSVNQYVADFEKLLRDISRNSGSSNSVRKYLISDTGKVYTMLAHASGRIQ